MVYAAKATAEPMASGPNKMSAAYITRKPLRKSMTGSPSGYAGDDSPQVERRTRKCRFGNERAGILATSGALPATLLCLAI